MPNVYLVEITEQPIELYKLLKIADLVSGGGEAKVMISEGYVLLNNEVEFQKRKKVYDGDYIQFGDNIIEVQFVGSEHSIDINATHNISADMKPSEIDSTKATASNKKINVKNNTKNGTKNNKSRSPRNSGKRRAISF